MQNIEITEGQMTLKKIGSLFIARTRNEVKIGSLARCTTWLAYKAQK